MRYSQGETAKPEVSKGGDFSTSYSGLTGLIVKRKYKRTVVDDLDPMFIHFFLTFFNDSCLM